MDKNKESTCTALQPFYFIFWLFCLFLCLFVFHITEKHYTERVEQKTQESAIPIDIENALRFVHPSARRAWDTRDFLVIFGIPSLDIPIRKRRRHMQRISCWQFPEVATRHNNYTGAMLVLYVLAKHPLNAYMLSDALIGEAVQWNDIVIHPMYEARIATHKAKGEKCPLAVEDAIAASRKTFFWFQFAVIQFPRVPYLGKGDDDIFISVPQYLADLRRLPGNRMYWGKYVSQLVYINKQRDTVKVRYMLGFCYTLSRDTAESLASYKPMRRLMTLPYTNETEPEFIAMQLQCEDVMIGRVLRKMGFPVIYVAEGSARFHTFSHLPVTHIIVATQKPEESEYYELMDRILSHTRALNSTQITKQEPDFYFMQTAL